MTPASPIRRTRRTLLAWLAACALLAFLPRLGLAAAHDHVPGQASHECHACVLAQTPGLTTDEPVALAAPVACDFHPASPAAVSAPLAFSFAVAWACGPPA